MADLADHRPGRPAPPTSSSRSAWPIGYARIDSPIGPLSWPGTGCGVSSVECAADDATFAASHAARTGRRAFARSALPARLARTIERRLGGDRRVRIDLDLRGHTDFERDVWRKALEIPRGEVRPYGWVAAEIGRPKAVRAVGTALGHNPVPAHRAVPSGRPDATARSASTRSADRATSGRSCAAEGLDPDGLEAPAARRRSGYLGSDTTHIVLPADVPHARGITRRATGSAVPVARGCRRRRLPAVQGLPAGLRGGVARRLSASPARDVRPTGLGQPRPS